MKTKITAKYQVTVPREIRDHFNLHIADVIDWNIEAGRVVVDAGAAAILKWRGKIESKPGTFSDQRKEARLRSNWPYP